jgi:hypothetical protein
MNMNLDIVKNLHTTSAPNTPWEDFVSELETGLSLIEQSDDLHKGTLADMRAANIALTYNRELMMQYLMD